MTPRIGSLCSGYGGLDMGLASVIGGETSWLCEYDKHPSTILAERFPGVPNYGDITDTDWSQVEPVDWITAGYPCQPFSHAGKRQGTKDERHIWPHVAECIRLVRPGHVLLENVAGHLSLGFGDVLGDLAALGYDARWGVIRAADVGAPHGRKRVFIVATDSEGAGRERGGLRGGAATDGEVFDEQPGDAGPVVATDTRSGSLAGAAATGHGLSVAAERGSQPATDTDQLGRDGLTELDAPTATGVDGEHRGHTDGRDDGTDWGAYTGAIHRWERTLGRPAPAPTEPGRNGPRLAPPFVEWMMGLPAGWVTDVDIPRNAQLKALGNGVVPQQATGAVRWLMDIDTPAPISDEVPLLGTPNAHERTHTPRRVDHGIQLANQVAEMVTE